MENTQVFIKKINIKKLRHLSNIEIAISGESRKHLILTGKNGSGKTSLLLSLKDYLLGLENNQLNSIPNLKQSIKTWENSIQVLQKNQLKKDDVEKSTSINQIENMKKQIQNFQSIIDKYENTLSIEFSDYSNLYKDYGNGNFIIAYFDAKRTAILNVPKGVAKIDLKEKYAINDKVGINFIQHIVNLKADRSFARDDNNSAVVNEIDSWFSVFENSLKEIFDDDKLILEFDRVNYNFNLIIAGHEKTDLNHLSDGYSAILNIVTELILRMERKSSKIYNLQGFVFIDELETHLHIELQKKILPFLSKFFPNIQFIITTHSPFVVSSIENAIVFDLEKKYNVENLTGYSVDAIIESYFDSDKYSQELKLRVQRLEYLISKKDRTDDDQIELVQLRKYFSEIPKFNSPELVLKLQQLEFSNLGKDD